MLWKLPSRWEIRKKSWFSWFQKKSAMKVGSIFEIWGLRMEPNWKRRRELPSKRQTHPLVLKTRRKRQIPHEARSYRFLSSLNHTQHKPSPNKSSITLTIDRQVLKDTITMKGLLSVLLAATLTASANAGGAVEIHSENFDALTKGKNSFIKFVRHPKEAIEFCWAG